MKENELTRRDFIRLGVGLLIGIKSGDLTVPLAASINQVTETVTKVQTGNAGMAEAVDQKCKNSTDKEKCVHQYVTSEVNLLNAVIAAPLMEEEIFRFFPAIFASIVDHRDNFAKDLLLGTGKFTLSRREVIIGAVSTVLFGACHNFTDAGFNTTTIPASQLVDGAIYWYLQRTFGFGSNILAHASHNYIAITSS